MQTNFLTVSSDNKRLCAKRRHDRTCRISRKTRFDFKNAAAHRAIYDQRFADFAGFSRSRKISNFRPKLATKFRDTYDIGTYRTVEGDVAFGLRQIVDIALKALSPVDQ